MGEHRVQALRPARAVVPQRLPQPGQVAQPLDVLRPRPSLFFAHAPFTQTAHTGARIPRSGAGLRPVWDMQITRANAQATIPLQTALPCRRALLRKTTIASCFASL